MMGRGEYHRYNAKISTANLLCVRLAEFKKHKCLTTGQSYAWQWNRGPEIVTSVGFTVTESDICFRYAIKDKEDNLLTVSKTIPLTLTSCHFGGHRKWFLCGCGRKVATMFIYGQKIACRHCFNAVYPSQRGNTIEQKRRKIRKLVAKLKDNRYKPKGMHWKTFARIKNEWIKANIKKDELVKLDFARRFPETEFWTA